MKIHINALAAIGCVLALSPVHVAAQLLGPTPYLSAADSPFVQAGIQGLVIEDFEDGLLNTPGLSIRANLSSVTGIVFGPSTFTDSVDADDGLIDGFGRGGHVFSTTPNIAAENLGLTMSFSEETLGSLPTHAGFVWTDGSTRPKIAEFYDRNDQLIGVIGPVQVGDGSFAGTTSEDRFFGMVWEDGIKTMVIRAPGSANNIEIDHVQYNVVPEPATLVVIGAGLIAIRLRGRK